MGEPYTYLRGMLLLSVCGLIDSDGTAQAPGAGRSPLHSAMNQQAEKHFDVNPLVARSITREATPGQKCG